MRKSTSELGYNRVDGAGRPKFEFHTDRDWGRPRKSPAAATETTAPCFLDQSKFQRARSAPGRSVSLFPEPAPVWKGPYIPARGRRTISPYSRGTRRPVSAWTRCRTSAGRCPTRCRSRPPFVSGRESPGTYAFPYGCPSAGSRIGHRLGMRQNQQREFSFCKRPRSCIVIYIYQ